MTAALFAVNTGETLQELHQKCNFRGEQIPGNKQKLEI